MRSRGAVSPRSDSPMGPAPTRVPRIALPPAMTLASSDRVPTTRPTARPPDAAPSAAALDQQSRTDDGDDPDGRHEQRHPVEVLLHDARPHEAGLDAAAEEGRQTAAAAPV